MHFNSRLLILMVSLFLMPGKPLPELALSEPTLPVMALPENVPPKTVEHRTGNAVARCYGKTPCNACSNCSQCQYCNAGGTCGKCIKKAPQKQGAYSNVRTQSQSKPQPRAQPSVTGQCKAITKKGTQCSRKASSGNYCWQHG